jgi:hypothetical protein
MRRVAWFGVCALLWANVASAQGGPWQKTLENALKETYKLTKTATFSANRVTSPGAIYVVTQEGVLGDLADDATVMVTKVQDGRVLQPGGIFGKATSRPFKQGEKVFIRDISVKEDAVLIQVLSTETFSVNQKGSTQQSRYKGALRFEIPPRLLSQMRAEEFKPLVSKVIRLDSDTGNGGPKTIELGQSIAQVESVLGQPSTVVKLGGKTIYSYKDMKVVFVNGRVSDVQ